MSKKTQSKKIKGTAQPAWNARLSDTQLILLTTAASRDDNSVLPVPESVKARGGALAKSVQALIDRDLIKEIQVKRDQPEWRIEEDGRRIGLKVARAGLLAISATDEQSDADSDGQANAPADEKADADTKKQRPVTNAAKSEGNPNAIRQGTKGDTVLRLLQGKSGASIEDLTKATDWQAHSVRGFISGTLKKRMGLIVLSEKDDKGTRRYRLEAEADA